MARTTIPTLLSRLRSRNSDQVEKTSEALRARVEAEPESFRDSEVISALMQLLSYPQNWTTRKAAQHALETAAPEEAARRILAGLKHPDKKRRTAAAKRLSEVASRYSPVGEQIYKTGLPVLIQATRDDNMLVRSNAVQALGLLEAVEGVPAMVEALDVDDGFTIGTALIALSHVGKRAAAALPRAIELLGSSDGHYAAQLIGSMGAAGVEAIPHLERVRAEAKENGDDELEEACGEALKKLKRAAKKK